MPGCCSRCGRRVYAAEEKLALGRSWHLECFTCAICNRTLDSSNMSECKKRDEIYCSSCYRKYLGLQGYGFGVTGPTLVNHNPLIFEKLPNKCPNSDKYVENCVQDPRLIPPPPSRLGQSLISKIRIPFYYQNHPSLNPGDPCRTPPLVRINDGYKSETISSNNYDDTYGSGSEPGSNPNPPEPNYDQSESEDWRPIPPQRPPSRSPSRSGSTNRNFQLSSDETSQKYCLPSPPRRSLQPKLSYDDIAPNPPCPPGNTMPYRTNNNSQGPYQAKSSIEKSTSRKYSE